MDIRDILKSFDNISEATTTTDKGTVHKSGPGEYGNRHGSDDVKDQYGKPIGRVSLGKMGLANEPKRGKGRPPNPDKPKEYDSTALNKAMGIGKAPKPTGKPSVKHSLKEYFDQLDQALNEEGYSTAPMPGAVAVKDASGKVVATAKNPAAAAAFEKGDITIGGDEQGMAEGELDEMWGNPYDDDKVDAINAANPPKAPSGQPNRMTPKPATHVASAPRQANTLDHDAWDKFTGRDKAMAEDDKNWIKGAIKHPGAFTAKAKSHGMTPAQFRAKVLAHKEDYPAKTEKQAQLAKTLSKMKEAEAPQHFAQSSPLSTANRGVLEGKKGVNPFAKKDTKKKPDADKDGVPDWADKKPGKDDNEGKKKGAAPQKGVNPFAKKTDNVKEAQGDDAKERAAEKQADRDDPMSPSYKDKKEKSSGVTRVKGKSYGNQADTDKDLDEGKSCSKGHTKMTKGCKECAGMYEALKGGQKKLDVNHNNKLEKDDFAALRAKKKVKESMFKHNVRFVNESLEFLLQEDEEGKAKAITAAGDMVNDFTSWMQRVGQYQTKSMIELADAIKADFGPTEAEAFKAAVAPALSATLEVLTQQREAISGAVAVLAGEAAPEAPMGMEPSMSPEPGMDISAPDEMNPEPVGDEFGAADAAAGGAETSGRAMRESKFARRLAESHSIMSKLAK